MNPAINIAARDERSAPRRLLRGMLAIGAAIRTETRMFSSAADFGRDYSAGSNWLLSSLAAPLELGALTSRLIFHSVANSLIAVSITIRATKFATKPECSRLLIEVS